MKNEPRTRIDCYFHEMRTFDNSYGDTPLDGSPRGYSEKYMASSTRQIEQLNKKYKIRKHLGKIDGNLVESTLTADDGSSFASKIHVMMTDRSYENFEEFCDRLDPETREHVLNKAW